MTTRTKQSSNQNPRRGKSGNSNSNTVPVFSALKPAEKEQYVLVAEVKPEWEEERVIQFCRQYSFDRVAIESAIATAFEFDRPAHDESAEQWKTVGKTETAAAPAHPASGNGFSKGNKGQSRDHKNSTFKKGTGNKGDKKWEDRDRKPHERGSHKEHRDRSGNKENTASTNGAEPAAPAFQLPVAGKSYAASLGIKPKEPVRPPSRSPPPATSGSPVANAPAKTEASPMASSPSVDETEHANVAATENISTSPVASAESNEPIISATQNITENAPSVEVGGNVNAFNSSSSASPTSTSVSTNSGSKMWRKKETSASPTASSSPSPSLPSSLSSPQISTTVDSSFQSGQQSTSEATLHAQSETIIASQQQSVYTSVNVGAAPSVSLFSSVSEFVNDTVILPKHLQDAQFGDSSIQFGARVRQPPKQKPAPQPMNVPSPAKEPAAPQVSHAQESVPHPLTSSALFNPTHAAPAPVASYPPQTVQPIVPVLSTSVADAQPAYSSAQNKSIGSVEQLTEDTSNLSLSHTYGDSTSQLPYQYPPVDMPAQSPPVFSPHHHHSYHDQSQYYEYDSQFNHPSYASNTNQFRNQKPNQRQQQAVGPQNPVNYSNKYSKTGGRGGPPQPPSTAVPFAGQHYQPTPHIPQVNYGMNYSPYGNPQYQMHPHASYYHPAPPFQQMGPTPPGFNRQYNYGHYNQPTQYPPPVQAPYNGQISPTGFEEYDTKKSIGPDSHSQSTAGVDSRMSQYQSFPMSGPPPAGSGPVGSSNVMPHQHVPNQNPHVQQHHGQPQHQQPPQHQLNSSYKW